MAALTDHERNENVHENRTLGFLDSVPFLPFALRKLPDAFGLLPHRGTPLFLY